MVRIEKRLGDLTRLLGVVVCRLGAVVSGIAFWTGILTPLSYLLFVIPGLQAEARFSTLLALVAVHCVALVIGYPHRRSES